MVLVKRTCPPERRKAIIAVTLTTSSPTLSLSSPQDPENPFELVITLRIAESTHPGRPITIKTDGTIFCPSQEDGDFDTLALGTVTPLQSTSDPKKSISLGHYKVHWARPDGPEPEDLKERSRAHFLTIPAGGSVQVRHKMPVSRIFRFPGRLTKEDVHPGEEFRLGLIDGYVGATWWCWGELEGDLKDKKFSAWSEGSTSAHTKRPTKEMMEEGWVVGENVAELVFEDRGGAATFRFTE
ncbi:hypothetical protein K490DRAFT_63586 [Saccharata proteae CBS 121410]|uniref:Protein HRI1 n=1 Tax=Saccharata proteae CBS 121410 TaxID=1314787 RepID=A0A6A5YF78_9PEZI|nr:hypothetical protein K490DRAFT_63586 [Saccharata proteae CBS 121410]